ncbi:MAG: PAS domain S-box protein [Bacteroidota bacterium]|nr:PAS domain S-box protein [Bacteroidota bacterium]
MNKKQPTRKKSGDSFDFTQIIERTGAVFFLTNKTGRFVFVNPFFVKLSGFEEKELLKKKIFDIVQKEYFETVKSHYSNQLKEKISRTYLEFPILTKTGKVKWFGQSTTLLLDNGKATGFQAIAFDITIRKLVDQETLTLSKIINQTTEMIVVTDKNGIIQYVNSAFEKTTQYTKSEAIGKQLSILDSDNQTKDYIHNIWQQVLSGKVWHGYFKNRKKDGTLYDEELTINPVFDESGKLINVVEIKRNITEELKAKKAAEQAEANFKSIFENSIEGIYQSSADGRIITTNKALLKMLGYSNIEEFSNIPASQFYVNPDDRKAFQALMDRDGKVTDYEIRLKRKDGSEITVLENSRAVTAPEGEILYYEGMIQDITNRKATENAIRSLNLQKDKFLSIVSHDLRAPFNSILGFTEMLLDDKTEFTEEEKKEFLQFIKQAAEQQLHLLNNLLDWSRLETGRIRFEPRPTNLNELVGRSIVSLAGNVFRKNIKLFANIPERTIVNVDENLMLQLFGNLISNAIKFTPQNGKVWVDFIEDEGSFVKIAVRDTGVGIPKEDFDKLFRIDTKYFSRGTEGEEGSGLGLALVAEVVQRHGGTITIDSEVDQGTSFIFTIPAVQKSVLIVDDNKGNRSLAVHYMEQILPDVLLLEALDGYEAMSIALSRLPVLILADFAMPGMDGLRLLKELRSQPQTKNTPVIIITSFESKADAEALMQYGVKEIFIKPANKDDLQKAVMKYIK